MSTDATKGLVRPWFPTRQKLYLHFAKSHFYGFTRALIEPKIHRIEAIIQKRVRWQLHSGRLLSVDAA